RVAGLSSRVNARTGTLGGAPSRHRRSTAGRLASTALALSTATIPGAASLRADATRACGKSFRNVSTRAFRVAESSSRTRIIGIALSVLRRRAAAAQRGRMPEHSRRMSMTKEILIVHHVDRRTDVMMPYAPGIVVRRGQLVFLSGVTAAAVYHSYFYREEE